jgi:transmembrane sensor
VSTSSEDRRAIDLALAEWLTKLGRDDGDRYRRSFEEWLAQDPAREQAFQAFKAADRDIGRTSLPIPPLHPPRRTTYRPQFVQAAIAALVILGVGGGGAYLLMRPGAQNKLSGTQYAAGDTPRAIELPHGPSLMLDAHAIVLTSMETDGPMLLLEQGRTRVRLPASGERPYVVAAGDLRLTAHGAVFDVARDGDTIQVTPLAGEVTVRHASGPAAVPLRAGNQIVATSHGDQIMPAPVDEPGWTSALLPLDGKTLGNLIDTGNRSGGKRIALDDSALANRPVQGQLPVSDTHNLALQIAAAFDLDLRETPTKYILARKS